MNPDGTSSDETRTKSTQKTTPKPRDAQGHFIKQSDPNSSEPSKSDSILPPIINYKKTANSEDPLVDFQVNNPIPPIKRILKKIFGNEEITIRIPVLTAIAIVAFGLGGASGFLTAIKTQLAERVPLVNTIFPTASPSPSPDFWVHETLFGTLSKQVNGNYYLLSAAGDVIKLIAPENVKFETLVGKKILAEGLYNKTEKTMSVEAADDLLLFSSTQPVPTIAPTPSPLETPTFTASPSPTPEAMN